MNPTISCCYKGKKTAAALLLESKNRWKLFSLSKTCSVVIRVTYLLNNVTAFPFVFCISSKETYFSREPLDLELDILYKIVNTILVFFEEKTRKRLFF